MENEGKKVKVNDQLKEILYIEMIRVQMDTFISIDKLIKKKLKDSEIPKHLTP